MKIRNPKLLIYSVLVTEGTGILASIFTAPAITTWYRELQKPFFTPPNWIFGPVWTLLYLLMGISLYLVWSSSVEEKKFVLKIFWIHLATNFLWSFIFFGLKSPALAFVDILILLGLIVYLIKIFWNINKWSSLLLIPYLLWTAFASILNFSIWWMN